jgi:hypothetical protein
VVGEAEADLWGDEVFVALRTWMEFTVVVLICEDYHGIESRKVLMDLLPSKFQARPLKLEGDDLTSVHKYSFLEEGSDVEVFLQFLD